MKLSRVEGILGGTPAVSLANGSIRRRPPDHDPGDFAGVRDDGVLPAVLIRQAGASASASAGTGRWRGCRRWRRRRSARQISDYGGPRPSGVDAVGAGKGSACIDVCPLCRLEGLAVQDLEARQVGVHRVRVCGDVDDLPDLRVAHRRLLAVAPAESSSRAMSSRYTSCCSGPARAGRPGR